MTITTMMSGSKFHNYTMMISGSKSHNYLFKLKPTDKTIDISPAKNKKKVNSVFSNILKQPRHCQLKG